MPLGENIKKYRELRGLSVPELADKMGIGKAGIYKWEANDTKPGLESLTDLSKALDVTVDDLLKENITPVDKPPDNKENLKVEGYRAVIEGETEYVMIPREVLKDVQLVSKAQIERDKAILERILTMNEKYVGMIEKGLIEAPKPATVEKAKK